MRLGEDSDVIGADFVRRVTVRGDSVRTDDNALDFALFHHLRRHIVADERHVYTGLHQLPRCQARTL